MTSSTKQFFSIFFSFALSLVLVSTVAAEELTLSGEQEISDDINDQNRLSISYPSGFLTWVAQYDSKPTQKAVYLALGTSGGWAAGMASGYSTLAAAEAKALEGCNSSRATYNIADTCKVYAQNNSVVYLTDTTPIPTPTPTPTSSATTISSSLEINIPSATYSTPLTGSLDLWLILEYSHSSGNSHYWKLKDLGTN